QLKVFVRRVRPRPQAEPVVRFETPPGHQGQVDFAEVRLPWGKRFALMVVLGYSRLLWLQFYTRQTMTVLRRGLEEAFAFFGGVPTEWLFDQLKAVILDDRRAQGGRVLENPEFLRFAAHGGFRIRACRPYRAKTKGKASARSATCATASSTAGGSPAMPISMPRRSSGSPRSPMPASMAPPTTCRRSASRATSGRSSVHWRPAPIARWCSCPSSRPSSARWWSGRGWRWSGGPSPRTPRSPEVASEDHGLGPRAPPHPAR